MPWFHSKRKLKNISFTKQFQIRYYGWWFLLTLGLTFLLCVAFYLLFESQWYDMLRNDPSQRADYLFLRSRFLNKILLMGCFIVMGLMALAIMTAHRVAGPFVALKKAFTEVKNGNFDYRIHFRREDELGDLQQSFNEMMNSLKPPGQGKSEGS